MWIIIYRPHNQLNCDTQYIGPFETWVEADEALVFEDSRAGLLAAQAAGMRSMFVTCCAGDVAENTPLATASMRDYRDLPPGFWAQLNSDSGDLALRLPL